MQFLKFIAIAALAMPGLAAPVTETAVKNHADEALATVNHLLTFTRREVVDAMKAAIAKRQPSTDKPAVLGYKREPGTDKPAVLGYKREEESAFNANAILDYCGAPKVE